MPRPRKTLTKTEQAKDPVTVHVRTQPAVALLIDELPYMIVHGIDKDAAHRHLLSELTRRYPQGFTVEYVE